MPQITQTLPGSTALTFAIGETWLMSSTSLDAGQPVDLTDAEVRFRVGDLTFDATTDDGGAWSVTVDPDEQTGIEPGKHLYEVRAELADGTVRTLHVGRLVLRASIR